MSDNEKIEAELRAMGYDPAQVGLRGEVFSKAMLGKIQAEARVKDLEAELDRMRKVWGRDQELIKLLEADKSALRALLVKAKEIIDWVSMTQYEREAVAADRKEIEQALQSQDPPAVPGYCTCDIPKEPGRIIEVKSVMPLIHTCGKPMRMPTQDLPAAGKGEVPLSEIKAVIEALLRALSTEWHIDKKNDALRERAIDILELESLKGRESPGDGR